MFAIIKNCNYDFNIEITIVAITNNIDKAKECFKKEVEKEVEIQQQNGIKYDTVEDDEKSYCAYNEGYEATDGVRIYIDEAPFISENS